MAVLAVTVPVAYATLPGDGGGGYLSCQNSGTSPPFGGLHTESAGPCQAFMVQFMAREPGGGLHCGYSVYNVQILLIPAWTDWWHSGNFCSDGSWHYSRLATQNQNLLTQMRLNTDNTQWAIQQYRLAG